MGWGSGSAVFNDMAEALVDAEASDEVITKTLAKVIPNLRSEDWDTYDESLDYFSDNSAVVEAFRQNGIFLEYCDDPEPGERSWYSCIKEAGHNDSHENRLGRLWPNR